jgi:hypothetical protein
MVQNLSEMEPGYSLTKGPITLYEQSRYSQKPNILISCEQGVHNSGHFTIGQMHVSRATE